MFRGEPWALNTILTGFLFFIVTLMLGTMMPGVMITNSVVFGVVPAHFTAAFLGWIGLVILGAQLQFFRAITAERRYEPENLRPIYWGFATLGVLLMIGGDLLRHGWMVVLGLVFYSITIVIHSFWIIPKIKNKLFKFPLNYLLGSHVFLVTGMILIWLQVLNDPLGLADNFEIIHVLTIGWISLNLQGALIRALPMFLGQVIDRSMRQWIDRHFVFSFVSNIVLLAGLITSQSIITWIGGTLWLLVWLWVVVLLFRSIFLSKRSIEYPATLWFIGPGLLFLAFGAMLGFHDAEAASGFPRAVHIHSSLLVGLSIIMIGAINRITSFQMFTLAYTGRRDTGVAVSDFIKEKYMRVIAPGLLISGFVVLLGFARAASRPLMLLGITGYVLFVLIFGIYLLRNYIHYRQQMKFAIPYDKKPSEVDNDAK